ncbi:hypothetical protein [Embleya sp. NPDC005575]|uniref:hypothetical protein n=1 Tax=Embleya sp. NPDC005575 TaxID=3156892 RepID=UPI0033A13012
MDPHAQPPLLGQPGQGVDGARRVVRDVYAGDPCRFCSANNAWTRGRSSARGIGGTARLDERGFEAGLRLLPDGLAARPAR